MIDCCWKREGKWRKKSESNQPTFSLMNVVCWFAFISFLPRPESNQQMENLSFADGWRKASSEGRKQIKIKIKFLFWFVLAAAAPSTNSSIINPSTPSIQSKFNLIDGLVDWNWCNWLSCWWLAAAFASLISRNQIPQRAGQPAWFRWLLK
mgnify:FL=1